MLQATLPDIVSDIISPIREDTKTVLLVEEEPLVRSILCRLLKEYGFFTMEAANGAEAVIRAEVFFYPIHLLIADLSIKKMSGYELADRMAFLHPETRVLFLSNLSDRTCAGDQAPEQGAAFLQKPFAPDALLQKVFELLSADS
jgi:two-component system cell cycle sensor histidine kinase/response regulator CckA